MACLFCAFVGGFVFVWLGLAWPGLAWLGLAWLGLAWFAAVFTAPFCVCARVRVCCVCVACVLRAWVSLQATGVTTWEMPEGFVSVMSDSEISHGGSGASSMGSVSGSDDDGPPKVQTINGEEWEELETEAGLLYYHSITNGTVQWTPPAGFVIDDDDDMVSLLGDDEEDAAGGVGGVGGVPSDGLRGANLDNPDDWEVLSTDSGHEYYFNRRTKTTTWERPQVLDGGAHTSAPAAAPAASLSAGQQAAARDSGDGGGNPAEVGSGDGSGGVKNGAVGGGGVGVDDDDDDDDVAEVGRNAWVAVRGPDKVVYYYNDISGITQRNRPADF